MTSENSTASAPATEYESPIGKALLLATVLLVGLGAGFVAFKAGQSGAPGLVNSAGFSEGQREDIGKIVKDYLIKNPEVMIEVQSALQTKMAEEQAARTKQLVATHAKDLYRHPNAPLAGNPDGDITVVEFFDYNCGYCKRGFGDVAKLIESDKKIRFVFKELPILSKDSEEAAKIALAARAQGKYFEVHRALIEMKGRVTEATALEAAAKLGLDVERLKADRNGPAVKEELARVETLANAMGINGTPHFMIGDESVDGAPENLFQMLSEKVATFRKNGCSYC